MRAACFRKLSVGAACVSMLALAALSACAPAPGTAAAAIYPVREVRLVVPFPQGGVTDINSRVLARHLSRFWGQPVTVVNMPGEGGTTGTLQVLAAPRDGYTMMMSATGQATQNPALDSRLPYRWDEPTLVARTSVSPLVLVVKGDSPWGSVQQMMADVRARPQSYRFGTSGQGGVGSIAIAVLFGSSGIDSRQLERVPLQGGAPLLDAVITGKTDFAAQYLAEMGPQLASGALKPLAVSTARRVRQLPLTPTGQEAGANTFTLIGWSGIAGPADLPPTVVERWDQAIAALAADPGFVKETEATGAEVAYLGPVAFKEALRVEYETALAQARQLGLRK